MDPITWLYIAYAILVVAVAIAMRPKTQNSKPPSLTDFSVPTAEEGRDIKMIFGTAWIPDPNVLWYGNLRYIPIKAEGGK